MKTLYLVLILLLSLLIGCKDEENSILPVLTIEDRINVARPINYVGVIYIDVSKSDEYRRNVAGTTLSDAYAENGYLIVTTTVNGEVGSSYYFNLALAKKVNINSNNITLDY